VNSYLHIPASMHRRRFLFQSASGLVALMAPRAQDSAAPQVPSVNERLRTDASEAPLRMQFRGTTDGECRQWQTSFRSKLVELLGNPKAPKKWTVVPEAAVACDDHTRESMVLTADGMPPLPLYVLRPNGDASHKRPAILCIHGHGPLGHDAVAGVADDPEAVAAIAASNYDYARQLARLGFITVAPCLTPFGRRLGDRTPYGTQDPCAVTFIRMQLLGRVLMGENLRDLLWTLEYMRSRADIDARSIGCVGLSYGGRMTMLAAAVDSGIKVAIISGALNVMQERAATHYSCGAQVIPGLLEVGDVPEIASLIAPRPSLWEVGSEDTLINPRWADAALERMQRAYKALGAEANLQVDRFEGGHRWNGVRAVSLLKSVLGG
jgi:dienelactone hydrolase